MWKILEKRACLWRTRHRSFVPEDRQRVRSHLPEADTFVVCGFAGRDTRWRLWRSPHPGAVSTRAPSNFSCHCTDAAPQVDETVASANRLTSTSRCSCASVHHIQLEQVDAGVLASRICEKPCCWRCGRGSCQTSRSTRPRAHRPVRDQSFSFRADEARKAAWAAYAALLCTGTASDPRVTSAPPSAACATLFASHMLVGADRCRGTPPSCRRPSPRCA